MEPVLSKAPLLLPLLQLLPNPMVLSQDILPSQRTLAMANRLPPLPHRGTCTPPLERKVVTLTVIGTLLHVFFFSLLSPSVTMRTASRRATTRVTTPSPQHMASSSKATKLSRQEAMVSNRATSSKASSSSNRHLLLIPLNLLVHMASLHPASSVSRVDHPTTASPTITVRPPSVSRQLFGRSFIPALWLHLTASIYSRIFSVDNYRQDGQGAGAGYPGSESSRYSGGDRGGPGRDGFDRGGMMHRGRGGMRGGMG